MSCPGPSAISVDRTAGSMTIDPVSKSGADEPSRPEASPDVQMDPRPLDNVTTAAQDMASSLDVSLVHSQRIRKLNDYWVKKAKGKVPSRSGHRPGRRARSCCPT